MGGRGSSSGISDKGKKYGTEYKAVAQFGEIKVIRMNGNTSIKAPMETMTKIECMLLLTNRATSKVLLFMTTTAKE